MVVQINLFFFSATKIDLRNEDAETISTSEGNKLKRKIKASAIMECSAINREGLDEIFVKAIRTAVNKRTKKTYCVLL